MLFRTVEYMFNVQFQWSNCHRTFITYEACIHQEFVAHISPEVQVIFFHTRVSKCWLQLLSMHCFCWQYSGAVNVRCFLHNFWLHFFCNVCFVKYCKWHSCSMEYIYHVQWQLCMGHATQDCGSYLAVYIHKKNRATFHKLTLHSGVQCSLCSNWSLKVHSVLTARYQQPNVRCNSLFCKLKSRYVLDAYVNIVCHFFKLEGGKIYMLQFSDKLMVSKTSFDYSVIVIYIVY